MDEFKSFNSQCGGVLANMGKMIVNDDYYNQIEAQNKERQKELEEIRLAEWVRNPESGVRPRFFECTFDNYIVNTDEEKKNKQIVMDFVKNDKPGAILLMYGENGNGKTHLGTSIIRAMGGHYITSAMLQLEFESGSDFNSKLNRLGVIEKYSSNKMLVIDEIGRNTDPNIEKRILSILIGNRYDNNEKTCLITNSKKEDFVNLMGKAIYDRFTEVCTSVEFTQKSKRSELRK